jgi:ribosomal protein S18 acetylase RimI-like enzyme
MNIEIAECTAVDPPLMASIERLLPQLSESAQIPNADHVRRIVESSATTLLLARDADRADEIVGMLRVLMFAIPSGTRAQIHDVVVDASARGRGVAERLVRHALDLARASGARTVDLTSRPSRVAANRLYPRVGFKRHETNLYRYTFDEPEALRTRAARQRSS